METLEMTVAEATEIVADAIQEYGTPIWVSTIPSRVRRLVPTAVIAEFLRTAPKSEGWGTAQDGKNKIMSWAKNNVFAMTTIKDLAELGEISEATVRNMVKERPDIFKKSEGRQYEIRDPQADRKADK